MTGTMRGTTGRLSFTRLRSCTAGRRGTGRLSTPDVHEKADLIWQDATVPRIHRAYYDYESFLYRDPRHK